MTNYKAYSRPYIVLTAAMLMTMLSASVITPQSKAPPLKSPRLYIFDCGMLDNPDMERYSLKKGEFATNLMSVPCFLVVHPKGTLMWDTGAIPDSDFKSDGSPATVRYATSKKPLNKQLAEAGFKP